MWFETDTAMTKAMWTDIAAHLAPKGYHCNTRRGGYESIVSLTAHGPSSPGQSPARPYYGIGVNGPKHGVHALLICSKTALLERNHSAQPRLCCASRQRPNKASEHVIVFPIH